MPQLRLSQVNNLTEFFGTERQLLISILIVLTLGGKAFGHFTWDRLVVFAFECRGQRTVPYTPFKLNCNCSWCSSKKQAARVLVLNWKLQIGQVNDFLVQLLVADNALQHLQKPGPQQTCPGFGLVRHERGWNMKTHTCFDVFYGYGPSYRFGFWVFDLHSSIWERLISNI